MLNQGYVIRDLVSWDWLQRGPRKPIAAGRGCWPRRAATRRVWMCIRAGSKHAMIDAHVSFFQSWMSRGVEIIKKWMQMMGAVRSTSGTAHSGQNRIGLKYVSKKDRHCSPKLALNVEGTKAARANNGDTWRRMLLCRDAQTDRASSCHRNREVGLSKGHLVGIANGRDIVLSEDILRLRN